MLLCSNSSNSASLLNIKTWISVLKKLPKWMADEWLLSEWSDLTSPISSMLKMLPCFISNWLGNLKYQIQLLKQKILCRQFLFCTISFLCVTVMMMTMTTMTIMISSLCPEAGPLTFMPLGNEMSEVLFKV